MYERRFFIIHSCCAVLCVCVSMTSLMVSQFTLIHDFEKLYVVSSSIKHFFFACCCCFLFLPVVCGRKETKKNLIKLHSLHILTYKSLPTAAAHTHNWDPRFEYGNSSRLFISMPDFSAEFSQYKWNWGRAKRMNEKGMNLHKEWRRLAIMRYLNEILKRFFFFFAVESEKRKKKMSLNIQCLVIPCAYMMRMEGKRDESLGFTITIIGSTNVFHIFLLAASEKRKCKVE